MRRNNHYEAAFEAYLRSVRTPYVAVDESKRCLTKSESLKNVDFIVSPSESGISWLVDVKGRQFSRGRLWKNWSTQDDVRSLAHWENNFGRDFSALLVFAYAIEGDLAPLPAGQLFRFRGGLYGFVGIRLEHYLTAARVVSQRWDTLAMPTDRFRELARPMESFLQVGLSRAS